MSINENNMMNEIIAKVSRQIADIVKQTKDNPEYNAHNLAVDALKIARKVIREYTDEQLAFLPGEPNTKTGIYSIDLLPYVTCHPRCRETCGKIAKGRKFNKGKCYAFKLMYRNPVTCARYAINTALLIDRKNVFWFGVDRLMKTSRFLRCFVAGDAVIPGFFDGFCETLLANPHCKTQGFSKCYEIINDYIDKHGKLPDNLKQLLSGWDDMKPDNPHNLPISDVYDGTLPEGWLSCGNDCHHCACVGLGCWKAQAGDVVGLKKH